MKRKALAVLSLSSLTLSVAMCVSFSINKKVYEVEAYTAITPSTIPTTINLNDSTTAEIQNYYSELNSLSLTERRGKNLLKNLKPILKNGQIYFGYESTGGDAIWRLYEITDRDWEKSPASEIAGYDSTTNTITGYVYGSSASNPGSNPYIHALYVNRNADNQVRAWAKTGTTTSHGGNNEWCIDREHIWAKSHGFETNGKGGARGDPMHLWAGDSYVNSALHNNLYYGFVDTSRDYIDGKDKYAYDSGNLQGYSLTLGGDTYVFEPQDSDKGDIARAIFYMVARYNYLSGSDADGIDSNNPNLALTNSLDDYQSSGYQSTKTLLGKMGLVSDLLAWNELDPPDAWEIHRNNILYKNYTNNRNPFIDYPEWANIIWGEDDGYANPSKDNGIEYDENTLSISHHKIDIDVETTATLSATAPNGIQVTWSIEDNTIASLDKTTTLSGENVTITPLKAGETTINASATIAGNPVTVSCSLKVVAPIHVESVSLNKSAETLKVGGLLQLSVTFNPTDATNKNVTWSSSDTSVATVDASGKVTAVKAGTATITVKTEDGEKTATCVVTVEEEKSILASIPLPLLIGGGVALLVILVIVIIILAKSKKARKKVANMAKKQVKKSAKSAAKSKSKK